MLVAQRYALSKTVAIQKSVRNQPLNENSSTYSARRSMVEAKFGARLFASTVGLNEVIMPQRVRHQGEEGASSAQVEL
jgi:hypothetical protein